MYNVNRQPVYVYVLALVYPGDFSHSIPQILFHFKWFSKLFLSVIFSKQEKGYIYFVLPKAAIKISKFFKGNQRSGKDCLVYIYTIFVVRRQDYIKQIYI